MQLKNFKPFSKIEGAFRLTCDTTTGPVALESQSALKTENDEKFEQNLKLRIGIDQSRNFSLVLTAENKDRLEYRRLKSLAPIEVGQMRSQLQSIRLFELSSYFVANAEF